MTKTIKKITSSAVAASIAFSVFCGMIPTASADYVKKTVNDWNIYFQNGCRGDAYIDNENACNGSSSLKIVNYSVSVPNVYMSVSTPVTVEKGKTYRIGANMKSLHSTTLQFTIYDDYRRSLTMFGDTFDWTNYEYEWTSPIDGNVNFNMVIDGTTDGIWVDDAKFIDTATGENLIKNGTFEADGEEESGVSADSTAINADITKLYNKVLTSDTFTAYEMESVIGGFKYMPVYRADGITIDGKGNDWEKYTPSSMPTLPTQYQVYISDERKMDASAICKFAQDEDNLYLYIEVTDDVFHYEAGGKDYYWRGDSIQFALSKTDESYGTEFGLAHNPTTNRGEVYSSSLSDAELARIDIQTSASGDKVIYEAAIPWDLKFTNGRPSEFLFDVLVNDNDGDGRRYCLELTPGISEGKSNEKFPKLEIIDGDNDWYAWAEGEKSGYTHEDGKLTYYLVNKGNAKSFEITYRDGTAETVDVPAESGIRREFTFSFDSPGEQTVVASFKTNGGEKEVKSPISINYKPATAEYHKQVMETNSKHVSELKRLLKKCEAQGISPDYENVNYQVMVIFEKYLREDYENNFFDNTYYQEKTLNELYEEAKANLNAYLDGTKTALTAPKYITSETTFKDGTAYALTDWDGIIEERPLSFVGYCLFARRKDDIHDVKALGGNTVQMEIGPTEIIQSTPKYVEGQDMTLTLDPAKVAALRERLQTAAELDVAVTMLLSPHYFPSDFIDENSMRQTGESWMFLKYNVNADAARAFIKAWLEAIVPIVSEYESVQTILISNEPAFNVSYSGDYYLDDWHEYLRELYHDDINELNAAYGQENTSFDEIDFVRSNFVKSHDVKKFNDEVFASWHEWMADIVHSLTDKPVNAKVMKYVNSTHAYGLYNGTGYEKYHDFMDLNGYDMGDSYGNTEEGPFNPMMWIDYMRSLKDVAGINSENHIIPDRSKGFEDDVAHYVARSIYMGAIHGQAVSDIWAWDRAYDGVSDFNGSILFRPDTLAEVHKTLLDLNRNSYEISALQNREKEIGILYFDWSLQGDGATPYALEQAYKACTTNGKTVQFVTESQLEKINDCKMLIVANQKYASPEAVQCVANYIKNGGKVIIMNTDSLKKTDKNADNDAELVEYIYDNAYLIEYDGAANEIRNMTNEELYGKVRDIFIENNLYNIAVKDADTGEYLDGAEIDVAYYDGKIILNMVNYDEDRRVNVYFGDRLVEELYELNDCETIEKDVELKQYLPVTLSIETDNPFIDTYGHWAEENIVSLYGDGVVSGMTESSYAPQKTLTRAEFLALLMRTSGGSGADNGVMPEDVAASAWYAGSVGKAVSKGIVSADEAFRPNDAITREEMCGFIVKCYESEKGEINAANGLNFTDKDDIADKSSVEKAVSAGIMYGHDNGTFAPKSTATRAEAAAVVLRYTNK